MTIESAPGVQFLTTDPYQAHFMTNWFRPIISDARNNSSVLFTMIDKQAPEKVSGRFIIWPVRFGRNRGRNAIGPGGFLPDPGSQGGNTYSMETRTYMARIKVEGEILRRGETNGGAFIDAVTLEMDGLVDDIRVDYGRILNNDGSGRIAEVASVGSADITVQVNQELEGASTMTPMADKYFEVGDRISFWNDSGSTNRPSNPTGNLAFYVVSVTGNNTIGIALTPGGSAINPTTGMTGLAAGDWIVKASRHDTTLNQVSTGFRREQMGIGGIFHEDGVLDGNGASGTQQSGSNDYTTTSVVGHSFQGIAATSANPYNRAVVLDSGGASRPISEELLQQAFSDAEERNNADIKLIHSAYPAYNRYSALLKPDKRYNDTTELKGGHTTLTFNGVPWIKDRFAYKNQVTMMDPDELSIFEVEPLRPLAPLGTPQWERLHDTDAYFTGYVDSWNLGVNVRERCGARLVDLNA